MKSLLKFTVFFCVLALMVPSASLAKGGKPGEPSAGNNLSYPVIWAEGVAKALPGMPEMVPQLGGAYWYWWGTEGVDPDVVPLSCAPDPDDIAFCDNGITGTVGDIPGVGYEDALVKAFLQKDFANVWQAGSADWSAAPVNVHWIDWGDNLESVDWYTRSQVRTEVVLFQDLVEPMLEYEMRHVDGWGIDEVHGLAADKGNNAPMLGPGTRATVYSNCARLTIQKLLVLRDDPLLADLVWVPQEGWKEPEEYPGLPLINEPIFNKAVYDAGDGPGYYSAEINVKGRVIYGYTWSVRKLNDPTGTPPTAAGDYRVTFSFDGTCGTTTLNTYFIDGVTQIMVPLETVVEASIEAEVSAEEEPGGGAVAVLVPAQYDEFGNLIGGNLTYIDVRILERGGRK